MKKNTKVAVVTGAGSYIGLAIIDKLLQCEVDVIACDLEQNIKYISEKFPENQKLSLLAGDIVDEKYLESITEKIEKEYGGLDYLVLGAASFADSEANGTRDEWRSIFDINVISAARLMTLTRPLLKNRNKGSIVIISSISGLRSQPGRVLYPVTKAALLGLSRNMSQALAKDNIRVNAVLPGITWSRNIENRYKTRERAEKFASDIQYMGRMTDPEEVADGVLFLLSDQASGITGAELAVDGGYLAASPEALGHSQEKTPALWSPPIGPGRIYKYTQE